MLVGSLLFLTLFAVPLWNITLEAPQYPIPIGMDIYINKFKGVGDNDINNINIMNHYVGMKPIPEMIPEFAIFPAVIIGLVVLGVVFSLIGKRILYIVWFGSTLIFGVVAFYDFYQWEYEYGHDLNEHAAIKFTDEKGEPMTYQPPLIGSKKILNFRAVSMPRTGAYLMAIGMALSVLAFIKSRKEALNLKGESGLLLVLACSLMMHTSCQVKPAKISYGEDVCDFCMMTIVDRQHVSQLVTEKGKVYKYDAIECMVNDLAKWNRPKVALFLVADYARPGDFTNALDAGYLISAEIPSPMGANLSAFAESDYLKKTHSEKGGETLTWGQLQKKFQIPTN